MPPVTAMAARSPRQPRYLQLADQLRGDIAAGVFPDGFPTENALCTRFGVSRFTVREALRALQGFENWDDYVRNDPPVLMVRATPKLVESLWKTLGRVAAQSQGVQIPAIKHIKAGFASMRMLCGAAEVTPIHPFKIEQRVGENDVVYEGLYVFDPASVGPHCGTVTLVLFSDKDPDKGDSRVLEPGILRRIWDDFAPYRTGAAEVPR